MTVAAIRSHGEKWLAINVMMVLEMAMIKLKTNCHLLFVIVFKWWFLSLWYLWWWWLWWWTVFQSFFKLTMRTIQAPIMFMMNYIPLTMMLVMRKRKRSVLTKNLVENLCFLRKEGRDGWGQGMGKFWKGRNRNMKRYEIENEKRKCRYIEKNTSVPNIQRRSPPDLFGSERWNWQK